MSASSSGAGGGGDAGEERDFRDALRTISLSQGFALVPVEIRGPDIARALASWLDTKGFLCHVIEPLGDAAWQNVLADLFAIETRAATPSSEGAERRVVLVIGGRQTPPGIYAGLRLVNQRRDTLARHLACPLLWCGPPEFIKLTWERAPDFWSIRALPLRIDAPMERASVPPLWPMAWVADAPERLRAMLDAAREQGDLKNAARVAEQLGEALVARSKLDAAEEVIAEVGLTPSLLITRGIALARRGDVAGALESFAASAESERDASAGAASDAELQARRSTCQANLIFRRDRNAAVLLYERALQSFASTGDRTNEAIALANLGLASLAGGDFDDATDRLERALAVLREVGDERNEAHVLARLGCVALAQRDSRHASECFEEALVDFRHLGDRAGELAALRPLARAYLNVGDPEKAKDDAERAIAIATSLGDDAARREAEALRDEAIAEIA